MRIVFIGTVEFSLKALEKLVDINANVIGVCTKEKSNFNSDFADLTPICQSNKIPYVYADDINSKETIRWIKSLNPDIIFCFGWSSLIKYELLNLAPMGVIGYHPSSLPQNRGRHPLIWALALGLKQSASTFFIMEEDADDGDILSQIKFDILYEDDAKSIYNKVIEIALEQIGTFVPELENKIYKISKQDHSQANTWRKRSKKDGAIDFRMTSNAIYNLVRALTKPYVGAHLEYNGEDVVVWKAEEVAYDKLNIETGKIIEVENNTLLVKTYDGAIRILKHEFNELPVSGEYL